MVAYRTGVSAAAQDPGGTVLGGTGPGETGPGGFRRFSLSRVIMAVRQLLPAADARVPSVMAADGSGGIW